MFAILSCRSGKPSARSLAKALEIPLLSEARVDQTINWGLSTIPESGIVLNKPSAVARAVNKSRTLAVLSYWNIPCLEFTQNVLEACQWQQDGHIVVERHLISSYKGKGIRVVLPKDSLDSECPLYTKFILFKRECRIHVFKDQVIFEHEKLRRRGVKYADFARYVKSRATGYVFGFKHLAEKPFPDNVRRYAVSAVHALGLDFGAVDVGITADGSAFIIEVNTAPGLRGSTLQAWIGALKTYMNGELNNNEMSQLQCNSDGFRDRP